MYIWGLWILCEDHDDANVNVIQWPENTLLMRVSDEKRK